jgi:S-adenosylmethionine decarboxylase
MAAAMHRTALTTIAPHVFRKRLLIEGFFTVDVNEHTLRRFFTDLTTKLGLRTYGDPVIHATSGQGKAANEGFDGFVPLIDSGIYIAVWVKPRFFSTIVYTCADFNEDQAVAIVCAFLGAAEQQSAIF